MFFLATAVIHTSFFLVEKDHKALLKMQNLLLRFQMEKVQLDDMAVIYASKDLTAACISLKSSNCFLHSFSCQCSHSG